MRRRFFSMVVLFCAVWFVACNPPPPSILQVRDISPITVSLGQRITPLNLSLYLPAGAGPFTYSLTNQTAPAAISCVLSGSTLQSDYAYQGGTTQVTVTVTDNKNRSAYALITITVSVPAVAHKVPGINFSPYESGQDPNTGSTVTDDQVTQRMGIIAPYTTAIRTYGCENGLQNVGVIAHKFGLKTYIGAWIGKDLTANEKEVQCAIAAGKNGGMDGAVIGSEVLLRGDVPSSQLVAYMNEFRAAVPNVPVVTSDGYGPLIAYPDVANSSDFLFVNYYPFWQGTDIDHAVAYLNAENILLQVTYPGKTIVVSETGWPSGGNPVGNAVPSPQNAAAYFINFESWVQSQKIVAFWFEGFDEQWKAIYEGPQGAFWGSFDQNGLLKYGSDVFAGQTVSDNWSCKVPPGGKGTPTIQFTYVPPIGSTNLLKEQVLYVDPTAYDIAVFIHVNGGWWVKPTSSAPRATTINCDGTSVTNITTGGNDTQADQIAAFVLPKSYFVPDILGASTLPSDLSTNAIAQLTVSR